MVLMQASIRRAQRDRRRVGKSRRTDETSRRMDETPSRVCGRSTYRYRAADKQGLTVDNMGLKVFREPGWRSRLHAETVAFASEHPARVRTQAQGIWSVPWAVGRSASD